MTVPELAVMHPHLCQHNSRITKELNLPDLVAVLLLGTLDLSRGFVKVHDLHCVVTSRAEVVRRRLGSVGQR